MGDLDEIIAALIISVSEGNNDSGIRSSWGCSDCTGWRRLNDNDSCCWCRWNANDVGGCCRLSDKDGGAWC